MIFFYLKETFRSLGKAKLATIVSVTTVLLAIAFTLGSAAMVVLSNKLNERLLGKIEMQVFVSEGMSSTKTVELKEKLENVNSVKSVEYLSKEDAKRRFIEETGEDFEKILELNPLPASFIIRFDSDSLNSAGLTAASGQIENYEGVDDVIYDTDLSFRILNFINKTKFFVYVLSAILIGLAIYLIYFTNRLIMQNKVEQINTMKLVGAKLGTIVIPMFFSGIIIGVVAAVIAVAAYNVIIMLSEYYIDLSFVKKNYFINFIILFLGVFFGLTGSWLSAQRVSLKIDKI